MLRHVAREIWARIAFMRDPIGYHRKQGVRIGARVELIAGTIHTFGGEPYLVTIGDDVTISHGVDFITHDGGLRVVRDRHPGAYYYAPITVGDRAFLGSRATILPGVTIGARAVVGAGAVVADTVAPDMVVAGVPARPIKTVDEYALARRPDWIDTSGLDANAKERLIRQRLARTPFPPVQGRLRRDAHVRANDP